MSTLTLELDGLPVDVEVTGPGRKARLTIEADGSLHLHAASDVGESELTDFLKSKRGWVYKKLAEKQAFDCHDVTKDLVDGEGFLYLGRHYRLKLTDAERVRLDGGRLQLPAKLGGAGARALVDWYSSRGIDWLRPRAARWAERLRVTPRSLSVADLGRKWGSASNKGDVRVHWAVFQLRPALIDYVVVHELNHLKVPHHGPDFWMHLGRAMPDYLERKAELARTGARLWMGETNR